MPLAPHWEIEENHNEAGEGQGRWNIDEGSAAKEEEDTSVRQQTPVAPDLYVMFNNRIPGEFQVGKSVSVARRRGAVMSCRQAITLTWSWLRLSSALVGWSQKCISAWLPTG